MKKQIFKICYDNRLQKFHLCQYLTLCGITSFFRIGFSHKNKKIEVLRDLRKNFNNRLVVDFGPNKV